MRTTFQSLAVSGFLVAAIVVGLAARWSVVAENPDLTRLSRSPDAPSPTAPAASGLEQATFGAGCFWSTQVEFQQLIGVHSTVCGYSGGSAENPTYEQVCTGTTGHAEVVQVTFDPTVISYSELLEVFWHTHDPTTLNRQGADVGTQYRSVIFYHTPQQRQAAERVKRKLDASGAFGAQIVTALVPFTAFYPAEKYHQNYYVDHPGRPYCAAVIRPKLEKFAKAFADKLKPHAAKSR
jgi:peptide-methionine (S)-S-oxide reductase